MHAAMSTLDYQGASSSPGRHGSVNGKGVRLAAALGTALLIAALLAISAWMAATAGAEHGSATLGMTVGLLVGVPWIVLGAWTVIQVRVIGVRGPPFGRLSAFVAGVWAFLFVLAVTTSARISGTGHLADLLSFPARHLLVAVAVALVAFLGVAARDWWCERRATDGER